MNNRSIKVCFADDHHFVREAMVNLIKTFSRVNEVHAVSDGRKLLDVIPTFRPDIVLLDIRMDVMDGIEASEIIARQYPEIKLLILTLNEDPDTILKLAQTGVHGYITKFSEVENVERAIYQVIDKGYFY